MDPNSGGNIYNRLVLYQYMVYTNDIVITSRTLRWLKKQFKLLKVTLGVQVNEAKSKVPGNKKRYKTQGNSKGNQRFEEVK